LLFFCRSFTLKIDFSPSSSKKLLLCALKSFRAGLSFGSRGG
jgi:hypothetical protein